MKILKLRNNVTGGLSFLSKLELNLNMLSVGLFSKFTVDVKKFVMGGVAYVRHDHVLPVCLCGDLIMSRG